MKIKQFITKTDSSNATDEKVNDFIQEKRLLMSS